MSKQLYGNNSYFNYVQGAKPSQEAMDKRAFDQRLEEVAELIVMDLPAMLEEIIDCRAAELFAQCPECMKKVDNVTRESFDENYCRRLLAGKISNKIGRGLSFLQKTGK
ncbi:hypothetical protein ACSPD5_000322 [Escherichia coli]